MGASSGKTTNKVDLGELWALDQVRKLRVRGRDPAAHRAPAHLHHPVRPDHGGGEGEGEDADENELPSLEEAVAK